jgi:hypothetical protein
MGSFVSIMQRLGNYGNCFFSRSLHLQSTHHTAQCQRQGLSSQTPGLDVPDNETRPATANDYATLSSCLEKLRGGLIYPGGPPQFLYCSILVPHPPYASNQTYMDAVEQLAVDVPAQVPLDKLHPNDVSTAMLKHSLNTVRLGSRSLELGWIFFWGVAVEFFFC